ncbi:adenylate/guanylate cyclase domain-containing protein [Emcibacter nanhaiensis]|uniref:Adenylate/guanylate cyclase domain-containing protein n=1 Tax=Emcibacter nanhaiensis TaxID=1505037 RepID=A0A501PGY3_9PROT|nr:adenylate/guanylate cyclase domain-containing protein [Emcibacter nanhaiensis]TPD59337.1 adenylate/guanylate cyclase domain-containing protein [Emcibacter nanhaiensis]
MSNWSNKLTEKMEEILSTTWDVRTGNVIPDASDVKLKDGAVKIEAAFLYADLAGSSKLAEICPWSTTAKIIIAYLDCCTRSIRVNGGEVRSFDGDRVMGIFKGKTPCTDAVLTAREIDWMVHNKLNPLAKSKFRSIDENNLRIKHCIGIDFGEAYAVRAGIRDNNDLIWVGKSASFSAKLSDVRDYPFEVYVSSTCRNRLVKYEDGWSRENFSFAGKNYYAYKTKTPIEP